MKQLNPEEFKIIWANAPQELRAVAHASPPGVTTDVKKLPEEQTPAMYAKPNDLRRERRLPLADPAQRQYYASESWTVMPISKQVKEHFWNSFRYIPLATHDPARWNATMQYIKNCPEKPDKDKKQVARQHIDSDALAGSHAPSPPSGVRGGLAGQGDGTIWKGIVAMLFPHLGSNHAIGAMPVKSPVMIQFSNGGAAYYAGKGISNDGQKAAILGAVAGAHHVRLMAEHYGVPVVLHSDHCAKKLLPWFDGMLAADEEYYAANKKPLFRFETLQPLTLRSLLC